MKRILRTGAPSPRHAGCGPLQRRASRAAAVALLTGATLGANGSVAFAATGGYELFETLPVRPLALSADGSHLYAVNTADARVEVFSVGAAGALTSVGEVETGLEPVAVAARGNNEIWVTNFLSDSVSRIDVSDPSHPRITDTIPVGDEPRDIVVGGSSHDRVFVACAHRGQNRPGDPQLTTPGVGRADVWTIDADAPSAAPSIATVFGDTPRALAVSPDGSEVYVAVLNSGNQTTVLREPIVTAGGGTPPPPPGSTPNPPRTGLIVKWDGSKWTDEIGRNWNAAVPYSIPDRDVFVLDANASPPAQTGFVTGVGSMLFNMAVNPADGRLFVTNQDARNEVRFEPTLKGHLAEQDVTIIGGSTATPVHLNPHIHYDQAGTAEERAKTVGMPLDLVFEADGSAAYVAGFGSSNVAVLDGNAHVTARIAVGAGPAGLALRGDLHRLYALNHLDKTISIVDTSAKATVATVALAYDPEPASVRDGRRFLYDTVLSSAHGDNSCGTCHFSGDMDRKAWDLGDPFGAVAPNPNPFPINGSAQPFHPMKGPMTTQSLRGMADSGSMHWRGDKNGGFGDPLNPDLSFKQFNGAFVSLLGRDTPLSAEQMQAYADFALQIRYPPNPVAPLDGTLTDAEARGADLFVTGNHDRIATCEGCHNLPHGSGGFSTSEGEPQNFKVAHLRNAYAKIGLFRAAGPQVSETGFLHDGAIATVFNFLGGGAFQLDDNQQRDLEAFTLAFHTGLAPVVGQQVTVNAAGLSSAATLARLDLLQARADAGDCQLVAHGVLAGSMRGAVYVGGGRFRTDRNGEALVDAADLRARAATAGQEVTYTCVYPGGGERLGIDRDLDGAFDATEVEAGSDPADASSLPASGSRCGDGTRDGGEACDGSDFGATTCASLGYATGTPSCNAECLMDASTCTAAENRFLPDRVLLRRLTSEAGRQQVLVGSTVMPDDGLAFDATADDVAWTITQDGNFVWGGVIPAGDSRWKTSASGSKWKAGSTGQADGLRSMRIQVPHAGAVVFSMKATGASATSAAGQASLRLVLVVGGHSWSQDLRCTVSTGGGDLDCR